MKTKGINPALSSLFVIFVSYVYHKAI